MNPMYQDSMKTGGRSLVSHRLQVRNKTAVPEFQSPKVHFQLDESSTKHNPKSNSLTIGSTHNAYITHVEDGPYSFYVQLKSHSEEIQPKIDALCTRNPPMLNSAPLLPGSNILGRSRADGKFRRAVVMHVKATSCKVYYMDYGTTEELPQSEIYTISPMILDMAHPQAMGFCLAELQSVNLPESCKDVFTKMVLNKQILLRVTQNELGSLTQCCEMFLDGKNVRELLINVASPLEYTNQYPPRGREIEVNVSFVDCPTQFFVQYHSEIHILGMIQDSLSVFCPNQERLQNLSQLSIGSPIGSLYSIDNMWYRALVIGIDDDTVNVLYVDYGNRDNVRADQLCLLNRDLVRKWRSQAVECCLQGFENATPDPILAQEMENRVLGGHFTLKLQYLLGGNRLVVDLIDENGGSVVKMMNEFSKRISSTTGEGNIQSPTTVYPPKYPSQSSSYPSYDLDRGGGGDGGGDSVGVGRFGVGGGSSGRTNTSDNRSRPFNKHYEHDDRFVENYEDNGNRAVGSSASGSAGVNDRFKKKWEDRNGGGKWREEGSNWRDDCRRGEEATERGGGGGHRFGGSSGDTDGWEDRKNKDRSGRGERSGDTNRFGDRGERSGDSNRFGDRGERSGDSNRFGDRGERSGDSNRFGDRGDRSGDSNRFGDRGGNERGERSGGSNRFGDRGGGGERSGRFSEGRRSGSSGKWNDTTEDEKFGDRSDKFKSGGGGDRRNRYGEGNNERSGGNRFGNRDEDEEKSSEHGSTGEKYGGGGGSGRYGGGDRGSSRGGGDRGGDRNRDRRKFSGEQDNKFGDRKFGDRGDRGSGGGGGGGGGRFSGGDRPNRNRDQGDRGNGTGWRNNEKKTFDNSTKSRDSQKPCVADDAGEAWDVDDTPANDSPTTQVTCSVREYPNINIEIDKTYRVYFSSMGNEPNDIYVQMEDSLPLLDELREQIDAEEAAISKNNNRSIPGELLTPGLPVLARFSDDGFLYRAIVRNHTSGIVTVLFVDYGNYSQVTLSDLFTVTPELAAKPIQAQRVMLTDIKPISGKWESDQTIYNPYFETEDVLTLKVNVLKRLDGEIVSIGSLTGTDGKTISQKLIENSLAVATGETTTTGSVPTEEIPSQQQESALTKSGETATTSSVPTNEIPTQQQESALTMPDEWRNKLYHLVGQTFYADVVKIVDKNHFMLKICAADKTVECHLKDDCSISDMSSDSKVIVNVTGVEDQRRLLVSLYDCSGKQLGVSESEPGTGVISRICPMPVVKKRDVIYISHFSGQIVYIQSATSSNYLTELLDRLFEHYNSSEPDSSVVWGVGNMCCVISEDSNWYRAKIIDRNGDNYTVGFIDYGNNETVGVQQLRELHSDFYTAELCLGVQLPVEWIVTDPPLMKYVENEEFVCIFSRDGQNSWVVDLTYVSTGEKLVKKLVKESICKEKELPVEKYAEEENSTTVSTFKVGDSIPIVVSHVDTPTMFWVQLCSHLNLIEDLQQKLRDCIESMPAPIENTKVFAAKYTEDDVWYRAIGTGDGDSVRFIDYGNTDVAQSRKQLPEELLHPLEGYAIAMYLRVKPNSASWSEEAIKLFETFIDQQISAEIVSVDNNKILVDLKSNDQYLSNLLIDGNHGSLIEDVKQEDTALYDVLVLALIDVNNFYIQMLSDTNNQVEMIEFLSDAENFAKLDSCDVGDLIAIKYLLDEQWYRAKVICLNPFQAVFLDYGVVSEVTEFRALPDNLKAVPPLALYCSLNLESNHVMTEQFAIMTNDATRIFKLQFKSRGEPNIVDLQMENGENITDTLSNTYVSVGADEDANSPNMDENITAGSVLNNCVVCHANGPYDFYIHTPSTQGLVQDLIEKMEDALNFPKVENLQKGDIVAVISPEDETWYRCKIVDTEPEIGGYFIDYGNGALVTDYRSLPEELKSIPELAIKCSLHLPDGIGGWSAEAVLTFTELVNDNVSGFDVLVITVGDPWVVELIANNPARTKVTEELLKLCPVATPVASKPATRTASPAVLDLEQPPSEPLVQQIESPTEKIVALGVSPSTPISGRCYVTHVNSPNDFFMRDSNTSINLEKVALALSEIETNPQDEPYNIGDFAIAQIEGGFSRAKVIEVNPLKVALIDVGNVSETSTLLQVPDSIKGIPPTAMNCSLHVPDGQTVLTKKAEEEFSSITLNGNVEFTYRILSEEGSKPEVELSLNGENIINILNENLTKKEKSVQKNEEFTRDTLESNLSLKTGTSFKVTVSYVENLKHFYIQQVSSEMDIVANELLNAETFKSFEKLNIGDLVAARSLDDDAWYRAKIITVDPLVVIFIDFGNSSMVEDVRELPEDLSKFPPNCHLVELVMSEGVTEWNPEAETRFSTLIETTNEFDCTVISQNSIPPCIVRLSTTELGDISSFITSDENDKESRPIVLEKKCSDEGDAEKSEEVIDGSTLQEIDEPVEKDESFIETKDSSAKLSEDIPEQEEITSANVSKTPASNYLDKDEATNSAQEIKELNTTVDESSTNEATIEETLLESDSRLNISSNKSDTSTKVQSSNSDQKKRVKSVAEIKANAKSRIVTRSTSATPLKSGRGTPSPVHQKSKTVDANKKSSKPESQMRRSVSFEDKIIPGCVSGNIGK